MLRSIQDRNRKIPLDAEKAEVQEKLNSALAQDSEAREGLIEIQSRIAEHTSQIEEKKQEIMDLLGNRATTQAKIQHYDTTKEQITVRKAELARNILEVSEEGERLAERLREYEEELRKIQETIRGYNAQITENEQQIERLQKELSEKQEKLRIGADRLSQGGLPPGIFEKISPSVMTVMATVSERSWRIKTVKKV